MMVRVFPRCMAHDLSSQLSLTLKSQTSSLVLAAKNTSNSVLNWISDDFLTLKRRSLGFELSETNASEQLTISLVGNEIRAEDAMALLLKHKRGYHAADDEVGHNIEDDKMPKRVLGPERPSFLDGKMAFNTDDDFLTLKRRSLGSELSETNAFEQSTISSVGNEIRAEDVVALLLKHKRGYHVADDEAGPKIEDDKMPKRVLGPERPSFLDGKMDYESWVPPKGQSGDGRTSLNDRFGY